MYSLQFSVGVQPFGR